MACFLVTGAAGFIGTHLVRRLLADGHRVLAVDRRPPLLKEAGDQRLQVVVADLLTADLEPLVCDATYVVHLAGRPGVRESWAEFSAYARGNIETTQRLLESLRGKNVRKFVLASTSSVYGSAAMPAVEDGPIRPISPYGTTKQAAELLCDLYGRTAAIPWVALRYFTVYGPGQRADMAFDRWLRAAMDGLPLPLFGQGEQVRDFTYVSDAVEATVRAAVGQAEGMAVNVGGGSQVPIREAIRLIGAITGRPLRLEHLSAAPGDMPLTCADTRRMERELAMRPVVALPDGLRLQYESIRSEEGEPP